MATSIDIQFVVLNKNSIILTKDYPAIYTQCNKYVMSYNHIHQRAGAVAGNKAWRRWDNMPVSLQFRKLHSLKIHVLQRHKPLFNYEATWPT